MGLRQFIARRLAAIQRQPPLEEPGYPWSACASIGILAPSAHHPQWCAAIVVAPYDDRPPTLVYTRGSVEQWTHPGQAKERIASLVARQTIRNSQVDCVIASDEQWSTERGLIRRSWPTLDTWHNPHVTWRTLDSYTEETKAEAHRAYTALATGGLTWHAPRLDLSPRLWAGNNKAPRESAAMAGLAAVGLALRAARLRARTAPIVRYANTTQLADLINYTASDICTWCSATLEACAEDRAITARRLAKHYEQDIYEASTAGVGLDSIAPGEAISRNSDT